jgi:hypothetical protein
MHACHSGSAVAVVPGLLLLAAAPAGAADGEITIANQGEGDLHLNLASGSECGEGVTLTFRDSLYANRRASTFYLSAPSHHQSIHSGETAVLLARDPAPCVRTLRLTEPGRQTSCTFRYSVRVEAGRSLGAVEVVSAEPEGAFEKIDSDILMFWGS